MELRKFFSLMVSKFAANPVQTTWVPTVFSKKCPKTVFFSNFPFVLNLLFFFSSTCPSTHWLDVRHIPSTRVYKPLLMCIFLFNFLVRLSFKCDFYLRMV